MPRLGFNPRSGHTQIARIVCSPSTLMHYLFLVTLTAKNPALQRGSVPRWNEPHTDVAMVSSLVLSSWYVTDVADTVFLQNLKHPAAPPCVCCDAVGRFGAEAGNCGYNRSSGPLPKQTEWTQTKISSPGIFPVGTIHLLLGTFVSPGWSHSHTAHL